MRQLLVLLLLVLAANGPAFAQDKNWKKTLEQALKERYPLTQMDKGFFAGPGAIKGAGIQLVVQKRGLISQDNPKALIVRRSRIKNGELMTEQSATGTGFYIYKVGERVFVRAIEVDDGDVTFSLLTGDASEKTGGGGEQNRGNTTPSRYYATVSFMFDKPYLSTATVDDVVKAISQVLSTDDQISATKTIELNQTIAEVEKIF